MIKIENINAINKGSLLAVCDVHIIPWKLTLHDVKIFEKGASRWIGMPSKEIVNAAGDKKYLELVTFDNESSKIRFRNQISEAIDEYLLENPEMTPEAVIKIEDEPPF